MAKKKDALNGGEREREREREEFSQSKLEARIGKGEGYS
jgi:hypothetical protein